ncbi:hypothetical protein FA95DRAFT_1604904 [Auriscalpium vulgare]|uniref:Uncharacterized protein n=1 Tax=Auriscalpium vulgare TaxID=40419 RepID=A0ACB8RXK5_9AGAM|nr:hypothetical protein FA95DRAFT_1604904 [Auriscalpium vulgare]
MAGRLIFNFVGWAFLPDWTTKLILRYTARYFRAPPTPRHYRITFALVVLSYLTYNLIDAVRSPPPNNYQLLNVLPNADEAALKNAYRAFVRKNHPDRVGDAGAPMFIAVRAGYEALMKPAKRWAYDRFGPDILKCEHCKTPRDYLHEGVQNTIIYHVSTGLALLFFSAIGFNNGVAFWRYAFFFLFAASEFSLLFSPSAYLDDEGGFSLLRWLFPNRTPFQHILVLHQAFVFVSLALSRVAPVLFPPPVVAPKAETERMILDKIKGIDRELHALLQTELVAIQPSGSRAADGARVELDDGTMDILTREMEHLLIEGRLRSEGGDVARARREVITRERAEQAARPPRPWRRRTASAINVADKHHHHDAGSQSQSQNQNQLPSPESRARTPLLSEEPIDVDALEHREVLRERVNEMWRGLGASPSGSSSGKPLGYASGTLWTQKHLRARSKSC